MHPFEVASDMYKFGFWFTYWSLRTNNCYTRPQALWLIWVAYNFKRYRNKMHEEILDRP